MAHCYHGGAEGAGPERGHLEAVFRAILFFLGLVPQLKLPFSERFFLGWGRGCLLERSTPTLKAHPHLSPCPRRSTRVGAAAVERGGCVPFGAQLLLCGSRRLR